MSSQTKKQTNARQFERLVELMKENLDIAKGFYGTGTVRSDIIAKWDEIGKELDDLGPPTRSGQEWTKVWVGLKAKTKKILVHNKKEYRATGGGPNRILKLTAIQRDIDSMLGFSEIINPSGSSYGYSEEDSNNNDISTQPFEENNDDFDNSNLRTVDRGNNENDASQARSQVTLSQSTPYKRKSRVAVLSDRNEMLQQQTDLQKTMTDNYKRIEKNTYKISKHLQKLAETQTERNEILKENMKQKLIDTLEKRKLKIRELELKQQKIELKRRELDLMEASMQ